MLKYSMCGKCIGFYVSGADALLFLCVFCIFGYSCKEKKARRVNMKHDGERQERCCFRFRARWNETHDVPLKPTNVAGLYKHTCFFSLFLVFTSFSFCNIVCAWSFLLQPTVSLFCRSGKGLTWRFHALFFCPHLCLWGQWGYCLRILSFFIFRLFTYPPHFCSDQSLLLQFFLPSLPSSLNSLSCWPSL